MRIKMSLIAASATIAATSIILAGCTPPPEKPLVVTEDKVYPVSPASVKVSSGLVSGEVTELKITERIEKVSGTIVTPAKLSGKLMLKNTSADQTLRLVGGTVQFIDMQGQPIKLEDKRIGSILKFATYNTSDRLDPGQEAAQTMDIEFPAEALKLKRLKELRLDLSYIPSPFKEQSLNFGVSIGAP